MHMMSQRNLCLGRRTAISTNTFMAKYLMNWAQNVRLAYYPVFYVVNRGHINSFKKRVQRIFTDLFKDKSSLIFSSYVNFDDRVRQVQDSSKYQNFIISELQVFEKAVILRLSSAF